MKYIELLIASTALFGLIADSTIAKAADEYNVTKGTTTTGHSLALRGNDLVALTKQNNVTPGLAKFTQIHDGVAYYFASEETKRQFAANPEKYLPQFGGYCALGIALNKKLDGSPRYADIVDGKLYLLLNAAVFEAYKKDKAGTIAKANKLWPTIKHLTVQEANS
ncbi:MAG: hypothetical protein DHS20C08_11080 [Rhodomicrobium sp.]|nr:MAG: hypothetical protein DHS20C08_11080 [Rhodomicrobium sp.]